MSLFAVYSWSMLGRKVIYVDICGVFEEFTALEMNLRRYLRCFQSILLMIQFSSSAQTSCVVRFEMYQVLRIFSM